MAFNLGTKVFEFLKDNSGKKFTAREIASWIFETFPEYIEKKKSRSKAIVVPLNNDEAVVQQVIAEISSQRPRLQKKYPQIKTTEGRPRKYYYTVSSDSEEVKKVENLALNTKDTTPFKEHSLYPILSEFLLSELDVHSKRIDEKRSKNSHGPRGNKWLYPDLVGLEDLSKDWNREIKDCVKEYADKKTKLWSFEVKILVNRSNIREVFFQTVSNSSWANFAYLVASELEGTETLKELRILSSLHGIGFILLNVENPSESEIIIPAKERLEIDWNTANRLVTENKDFNEYIKIVRQFYQTGEIRKQDWDSISA